MEGDSAPAVEIVEEGGQPAMQNSDAAGNMKQSITSADPFRPQEGNNEGEQSNEAQLSQIHIEFGANSKLLTKIPRRWSKAKQSNFYYRQSAYDIGLAVSVTDEILNLEPLEDKVSLLR